MKKVRENIFNLILIAIAIFLIFACKKQLVWVFYYSKGIEHFKFVFPFVNNQITNDTFFTIAIGRSIVENGFTNMDTLTWHSNLAFPHSGFFDLIIYAIFNITHDFTSIYLYTVIMTCILLCILFLVTFKISKNIIVSIVYVLTAWYLGRATFYARAFQFSFIFFVLEYYFLQRLLEENKKRYSVIVVILGILIANMHSSVYPIYLVMFLPHIVEIILSKFNIQIPKIEIEKKEGTKLFLITALIAIFSGVCTPAGFAPYTDMFKVMLGISNSFIGEISKTTFNNNRMFFEIVIATILIGIIGKQKIKITDILYIAGFSVLTLLVYRGFFFFVFLSGISISRIVATYFKYNKVNLKIFIYIDLCLFGILFILLIISDCFRVMNNDLVSEEYYPVSLSEYIIKNENLEEMKIYNDFNYGSYLEYKGIKAFIDSRSGMFCEEFNSGCTILKDWYLVNQDATKFENIFDKYNIDSVVTEKDKNLSQELKKHEEWNLVYADNYWEFYKKEK